MIVAIHQPQFLPWLGYFHKMMMADAFCLLDNVQFKKNEWQNRNRIKTAAGWQWLTVPVQYRFPQKICEVPVNEGIDWRRKHLGSLDNNYRKSKYFTEYFDLMEKIYSRTWDFIANLNCHLIMELRMILGLESKQMILASEIPDLSEDPTQRLIDICRYLGGDIYLAGADGPKYMDMTAFAKQGIDVMVQEFKHPVYPQRYGTFASHLSIIDLLFNCGPESARIIAG